MREQANDDSKATIRSRVRSRRVAMSPRDRARATGQLTEQLIALTERLGARSLACYSAVSSEPDTGPFLEWAAGAGLEVLLPVSLAGSQLDWVRFEGPGALVPGRHGIAEPAGPRLGPDAASRCDLMLVPACAVDDRGTRLGWGMGYYDRCLAALPAATPVYAVVFDEDRFERLPRDPHDVPVTGAVSPSQTTAVLSGTG